MYSGGCMKFRNAASLTLATLVIVSFLHGCVSLHGHTEEGEPCGGLYNPISAMRHTWLPSERKPGEKVIACHVDDGWRKKPADDSIKHTKYTEEQRLRMAENAARIFYPMETHRFTIAQYIS